MDLFLALQLMNKMRNTENVEVDLTTSVQLKKGSVRYLISIEESEDSRKAYNFLDGMSTETTVNIYCTTTDYKTGKENHYSVEDFRNLIEKEF